MAPWERGQEPGTVLARGDAPRNPQESATPLTPVVSPA
jgi:hypothetical protein